MGGGEKVATLFVPILFVRGSPLFHPVCGFAAPRYERDRESKTTIAESEKEGKSILRFISTFTQTNYSQKYIVQKQNAEVTPIAKSKPSEEGWAKDPNGMLAETTPLQALRHVQQYMAYVFNANHSIIESPYRITEDDVYLSSFGNIPKTKPLQQPTHKHYSTRHTSTHH